MTTLVPDNTSGATPEPGAGAPPAPSSHELPPAPMSPARRHWLRFGVPALVVVAGTAAAVAIVVLGSDSDEAATADTIVVQTATAEQQDLIEFTDLPGTLDFADSVTVAAGTSGVVTAVVDDGSSIVRGDVIAEINAQPVAVFYGEVPMYRLLSEGADGDDVFALEQNLAALGYHATEDDDGNEIDADFSVDGVFDAATTDAVQRWQADLGVDETGLVEPSAVVMVSGPSQATAVAVEIGDRVQEGSRLLDLDITGSETTFHADHDGEIDLLVTSGEVSNGAVLYTADDRPITAVVVDPAAGLDLGDGRMLFEGVDDGDDVRALEEMLVALGYDADGDLDVDEEFDDDTTDAVTEWQEDLQDDWDEVVVDGTVDFTESGDIVIVDAGTTVDAVARSDAEIRARGAQLFTTTRTGGGRVVLTSVTVADQDTLVEGQSVDIEFPDGTIAAGVVSDVASSSTLDPSNPNADAEIAVEITVDDVPPSAEGFSQLDVEVKIVDQIASAVTVVPVSALVATGDGYAVEVVAGGSTQFVAVDPGMFANGFVEVDGIEPGTVVVVPR